MIRLHHFAPLVAVGAVLALTSGAQAQLDDGMPTNPFPGTIINLPADGNPAGDVGDATGAMLTQLNMEAGFNFATGRTEDMGPRTYSFTEVNVFVENGDPTTSANSNAVYNNCEINLMDGFLGNNAIIDSNSTLNVTSHIKSAVGVDNGIVAQEAIHQVDFTVVVNRVAICGRRWIAVFDKNINFGKRIGPRPHVLRPPRREVEASFHVKLSQHRACGVANIAGRISISWKVNDSSWKRIGRHSVV